MLYASKTIEKDAVRLAVTERLKEIGIKLPRKLSTPIAIRLDDKKPKTQLGVPLQSNSWKRKVHIVQGGEAKVPRLVYDAVTHLNGHTDVEGLFRVSGSIVRQRKLVSDLNQGLPTPDAHAHDMANILKRFFRELPEPLLTSRLLASFEQAWDIRESGTIDDVTYTETVLLLCLLLPVEHRHVLQYVMGFIKSVADRCDVNRMTAENLATVLTPNFTRSGSRSTLPTKRQLFAYTRVVELLILKAELIGVVPCGVEEKVKKINLVPFSSGDDVTEGQGDVVDGGVASGSTDPHAAEGGSGDLEQLGAKKKRKKRRSSSLSGFITKLTGLTTGSNRKTLLARKRTLPTAMEMHERFVAKKENEVEEEETKKESADELDFKIPPIEIGHVTVRRTPRLVRKSPGKRKTPHDDVALMSSSKRQAILANTINPNKIRPAFSKAPSTPPPSNVGLVATPQSPAVQSIVSLPVGGSPLCTPKMKTRRSASLKGKKIRKSPSIGRKIKRLSDSIFKKHEEPSLLTADRLSSFEIGARLAGEALDYERDQRDVETVKEWII